MSKTASLREGLDQIELPQGTVTYRAVGPTDSSQPPVVFVHGLLVDSQLWTSVADLLASDGIRSYAPNWPIGSHPIPMRPSADLSPQGIAAIINDFLAALGLENVTLVGNDTGGALCQFLIDADHSRVGRLVLTNCDAFDVFPPSEFDALIKVGRHASLVRPMLAALIPNVTRHSRNVFGGTFADTPPADITRSWIEPGLTNRGVRRDLAKLLSTIDPDDLLDVSTRFGAFEKPVHLVWGDDDAFFPIEFGQRLADAFPHCTLTRVEGARTFVPMEFPREVADAILRTLDPTT
jgi:pimeloyl-ACP methyl ester carboxylesterase